MNTVDPADQLLAIKRIQKALEIDPNDTSAMFELAGMQKKADLQRKLLNKILSIDPIHQGAREMLLELDRARLQAGFSHPTAIDSPSFSSPSATQATEKPLISRYPIVQQVFAYLFLVLPLFFMFQAFGDWGPFLFFTACFLLLLIPVWFVSARVELDSSGIKLSRLFGIYRQETEWAQIESIQPTLDGTSLKLKTTDGKSLGISAQMSQYQPTIEILMSLRPDLFKTTGFARDRTGMPGVTADSLTGSRTFKRHSFVNIGIVVLGILSCPLSVGVLVAQPLIGLIAVLFMGLLWTSQINTPHTISVQGNKLSTRSMRKQEEWTADQIKDISFKYTFRRPGIKRRFIRVETIHGRAFRLAGFACGDVILYSFLLDWWKLYRNNK